MTKFSELLAEYLDLREEDKRPNSKDWLEPPYVRAQREGRMIELLEEMDKFIKKPLPPGTATGSPG